MNSNQVTITTAPTAPAAPTNVTIVVVQSFFGPRIRVTWTDSSTNETGFRIQRATSATFTTGLNTATVGAGVQTYTTGILTRGRAYYFRVQSYNASGASTYVISTPPSLTP